MVKYTIGDALVRGIALLKQFNIPGAATDAAVLLGHVLDCTRLHLTVHRDDPLTKEQSDSYNTCIQRRCNNEPVSYITGSKEFMSLKFRVSPGVLIPRPDTEILVERAISELSGIESPVIIDMCTGSGAIAVSLAKYIPGSVVTGLDISPQALDIARLNAKENGAKVCFALHDVRKPYEAKADAVVSNPPYIPTADIAGLETNVADFEPHLALDGGHDGLDFYRSIVDNIPHCLKKGGLLAFEVGCGLAEDVTSLMKPRFEKISIDKDLAGIERVVYGYLY